MPKPHLIRLFLTACLLCPVYGETGTWTVVVLAVIAAGAEVEAADRKRTEQRNADQEGKSAHD